MNKQELIDAVAAQTGASKAQTGETLDTLLEVIKKAVSKGDAVQLIGFGSFGSGKRAARTGRNPKTGETIKIPAAKTVKFTAGKAFKDAVNKRETRACSRKNPPLGGFFVGRARHFRHSSRRPCKS